MNATLIDEANVKASGEILQNDIQKKMDSIAQKHAKTMKMDGFRQGKVPLHVVKAKFKDSLKQEATQACINDFYLSALNKLSLDTSKVIGEPFFDEFKEEADKISLSMKIGLKPDIKIGDLSSVAPSFTLPTPSKQRVQEKLQALANSRAKSIETTKEVLEDKDIANINFEGFLDGKAFEGGKGENFNLLIGSNQFVEGFEQQLIGQKVGEQREISVKFPESYQAKNLAGKDTTFNVLLNKIMEKEEVKIDDDFAKSMLGEEGNLASLEEKISQEVLNEEKSKLYAEELKEELLRNLASCIEFKIPENIIEQEMNVLFNNDLRALSKDELELIQDDKDKLKAKFEENREKATLSVKITFIIDKLAKDLKIETSDNEIYQRLYYEALMSSANPQEVIAYYRDNNLLPALKMASLEDKVVTYLLDESKGLNTAKK